MTTLSSDEALQLKIDIAMANRAWKEKDFKSSGTMIEARTKKNGGKGELPIVNTKIIMNQSQPLVNVELDKDVRAFWERYSERFEQVWTGISKESRRNLLVTIAPEIEYKDKTTEQQVLMPEFDPASLVDDERGFIRFVKAILKEDLRSNYLKDIDLVRNLILQKKVRPDDFKNSYLFLLEGGDYVGFEMEINYQKMVETNTQGAIQSLIEAGQAVEGPVFEHVLYRRNNLLMTTALIFDEMNGVVFYENPGIGKK